jgi:hypothetical protein
VYLRAAAIPRLTILVAIATVFVSSQPAIAHSTGPQLVSIFDRVTPAVTGVSINIRQTGTAPEFTVSARKPDQLEILGAAGEPFLRITGGECSENTKSLTAFLATDPNRIASQAPKSVDSNASPEWRKLNSKPSCTWFERRAEWPARTAPQDVVRKGKRATVFRWSVPATYNGQRVSIAGHVDWVPAPLDLGTLLVIPLLVVFGFYVLPLRRMLALLAGAAGAMNLTLLIKDRLNVASSWSLALVAATGLLSLLPVLLLWGRSRRSDIHLTIAAGVYSVLLNLARLTLPAGSFAVRAAQVAAIAAGAVLFIASVIALRSAEGGTPDIGQARVVPH